jgi:hypothetical protein
MKFVFTSAGLLALGAASLHAYDPEMTRQKTGQPFSVAATVRGFYDDNVTTSPDKFVRVDRDSDGNIIRRRSFDPRQDSFGVEVSPSAHLNLPMEQTYVSLGYIYSLRWYENRPNSSIDQSHEFNGKLRHQFGPRQDIGVSDTFVLTSEPTVAERFGIITAPTKTRSRSDVMHNTGAIDHNIGLTRLFGLSLGYVNNWYDYEQEGAGSRSALLDRIEHLWRADARYMVNPKLVALIGYSFQWATYTGDEFLLPTATRANLAAQREMADSRAERRALSRSLELMSDDRNSYSHFMYVGADYDLTAKLRASARVGAQFTDYYNNGESSVNPYADASLTYVYWPGDSVEVGVRHARNATDVSAVDTKGQPTLDAETTAVYLQVMHQITHQLVGSLIVQYQTSEFNDGANDGRTDDLYLIGVNLTYNFNRHFSAEVGYNYDFLCSDLKGRGYERNRFYVGFRATY